MKLVEICVRRPVLTTMMVMALVVLGVFSYFSLGVDLFPNIDFPFILIQTTLKGASPEEIETSVTKPIEETVNTISGIEDITSTSYEGMSQLLIKFALEKNIDVAAQDVRDKIAGITRQLPLGTDPPVVAKFDVGAIPVVNIAVYGDMDHIALTELAKKKIKENLETVDGVGAVGLTGGRMREIHVTVNPLKLTALGISIKQVKDALSQQNVEIPGGRVEEKNREFVLRTLGRIGKVSDFSNIVIANIRGVPIKISDVGGVEDTGEEMRSLAFFNGQPCVSLVVSKQSGTNTVALIDKVKERLEEIRPLLPSSVKTKIIGDQSEFIKRSVSTVEEHLVLGAIFAALMVLLFMGNVRSTLIAAVAIPTSVIGTFTFMELAGYTLNTMTLLSLTIGVGIVIDDSIVVLENIFRHMEELKKPPVQAAIEATREIGPAVIATTMSLLVIFVPLAYMRGIIGRFLRSYGITLSFAIAISLFVALTMTPMLCSIFLKVKHEEKKPLTRAADSLNAFLEKYYTAALVWALARRKTMVGIFAVLLAAAFPMLALIGKDFLPNDDTSKFQINVKAPEGTSIGAMRDIVGQIETDARRLPFVKNVLSSIGQGESFHVLGVNEGTVLVELAELGERTISQKEIIAKCRAMVSKYTGLRASIAPVGGFDVGRDADMNFVIAGPDLDKLQEYSSAETAALKKVKGIVDIDTSFSYARPEMRVTIDRNRAHDLGVKIEDIATSLRTMVGGEEDITKFKDRDELYQVRLRANENYRNSIETLSAMMIPNEQKGVVRLDSVATITKGVGPTQIDRYNRQRQVTVKANMQDMPVGRAIDKAQEIFRTLKAPPDYRTDLFGKAKELGRMLQGFIIVFLLSAIFMYMVLAGQFESFVHPVTIMVALPLTVPFALLSLIMTGEYLSMFSIMGIFMLVGVVKKNAILQVDYTNTLRSKGAERYKAIIEANQTRLRPILMTTCTLIAGMMPVALGTGAGSGSRRTMAIVIIGGQALSLLITLLMTPVVYSLFDDLQQWLKTRFGIADKTRQVQQPS